MDLEQKAIAEIEKLKAERWWDWHIDKIKNNIDKLCSNELF